MPTSVPGTCKPAHAVRLRLRHPTLQRGFTLVEVMVVLLIIGLMVSGVSLTVDHLHARDTERAVDRLRWSLEASAERARIQGLHIALERLADGYRFSVLHTDGRWIALEDPPVFTEQRFPDTLRWNTLAVEQQPSDRIVFNHRAPRYEIVLAHAGQPVRLAGQRSGAVIRVGDPPTP